MRITKSGKVFTAYFKCRVCKCEFEEDLSECYTWTADSNGVPESAKHACPCCSNDCRTATIVSDETTEDLQSGIVRVGINTDLTDTVGREVFYDGVTFGFIEKIDPASLEALIKAGRFITSETLIEVRRGVRDKSIFLVLEQNKWGGVLILKKRSELEQEV